MATLPDLSQLPLHVPQPTDALPAALWKLIRDKADALPYTKDDVDTVVRYQTYVSDTVDGEGATIDLWDHQGTLLSRLFRVAPEDALPRKYKPSLMRTVRKAMTQALTDLAQVGIEARFDPDDVPHQWKADASMPDDAHWDTEYLYGPEEQTIMGGASMNSMRVGVRIQNSETTQGPFVGRSSLHIHVPEALLDLLHESIQPRVLSRHRLVWRLGTMFVLNLLDDDAVIAQYYFVTTNWRADLGLGDHKFAERRAPHKIPWQALLSDPSDAADDDARARFVETLFGDNPRDGVRARGARAGAGAGVGERGGEREGEREI